MKNCITCGLCYQITTPLSGKTAYHCMRHIRNKVDDVFLLNRIGCDKYVECNISIPSNRGV